MLFLNNFLCYLRRPGHGGYAFVVLWILLSLFVGVIAAILPNTWVIFLVAPVVIAILAVHRPILMAGVVLVTAFGIVPFAALDFRVLLEASLYGSMVVALIIGIGWGFQYLQYILPYRNALIVLFAAWLVGLYLGVGSGYKYATADARRYVGFLALFIFSAAEFRKIGVALNLIMTAAGLAAAMLIIQLFSGMRVFAGAKGYTEGVSVGAEDITRGTAQGGDYLIVYAFYYCVLNLTGKLSGKRRFLYALGAALFLIGIIATFSRGVWLGVAVGLLALPVIHSRDRARVVKSMAIMLVGVSICMGGIFVAQPRIAEAVLLRVLSVGEEGGKGTSVGARFDENEQAINAIVDHGVIGMGHGAEYKKFINRNEIGFVNQASFIHNSYLWVGVKLGVVGLASIILFIVGFFSQVKIAERSDERSSIIAASCGGTMVALLIAGVIAPIWAQPSDMVAFSLLAVCVASAARGKLREEVVQ